MFGNFYRQDHLREIFATRGVVTVFLNDIEYDYHLQYKSILVKPILGGIPIFSNYFEGIMFIENNSKANSLSSSIGNERQGGGRIVVSLFLPNNQSPRAMHIPGALKG